MSIQTGNAKTGPTGIVVDVDEYSANGSTMLKDIVKIIKNVFADKEGATCSVLSREVKEQVEAKYGPAWQCIVGTEFRAYCSYARDSLVYFPPGQIAGEKGIMLFKQPC